MAWAMQKAGDEPARIAEKLKCTTEEIEHLIRNFESARAELSQDMIGMVVNAEVLTAMSGVGGRLRLAQQATRFTGAYDAENNPVMAPDHQTALEAIKVTGELAERVMPKSGGGINIGINNAPGNGNGNGGGGTSFESMVRLAEQRRKLELGDGNQPQTIAAEFTEDEIELDDPDDAGLDDDDEDDE